MTEALLLPAALDALKTKAGEKILGEPLDISSLQNQISTLSNNYDLDLTELESIGTQELQDAFNEVSSGESISVPSISTPAGNVRDLIEDQREQASNIKFSIKNKSKQLKEQIKSAIPVLQTYTINGRLANRSTGEPLKGVKVALGVSADQAVEEIPNIPNVNPELITSKVEINPNNFAYIPISGGNTVRTNNQGSFSINVRIPIIPKNQKTPLNFALIYTKSGFIPQTQLLLNGDRTIKSDLNVDTLIDINKAAQRAASEFDKAIDQVQSTISLIAMKLPDLAIYARKKALNKIVTIIKMQLLPLCVSLLIQFGITKLNQKNQKTCPTPDALQDVIRRRNRVTRQLNQIYQSIAINSALALAFGTLASTLRGVRLATDQLPTPQATGLPPAKDFGGLTFAQPYSFTAKLQHLNDELEKLEEANEGLNKSMLTNLIFVIAGAATCIVLLKAIDDLSQECAEEGGVELPQLVALNAELLALTEEEKTQGNAVVNSVNGFILSVETDNKNVVGTLKRRFAVAKNVDGVTLLKGESSFSSNDQILIDELIFYIQQNDLKAF